MDPFESVQEEARLSLLELSERLAQWRDMRQSAPADAASTRKSMLSTLSELQLDLQDLQATVDIASKEPSKYGLTLAELQRRRECVSSMQAEAASVKSELDAEQEQRARSERQGLLSGGSASSSGAYDTRPIDQPGHDGAKQRAAHRENANLVDQQQQQQMEEMQVQDAELGVLSESVQRLETMGRTMNEELKAQGRAFDEFAQEVEDTRSRMKAAVGVMNKMMKSKDNGKFCAILVLTLVLFALMYSVFS